MLHAFLWCPSVNSFKFHTCVHTTPGGECLRHFCSKRVPKACFTPRMLTAHKQTTVINTEWIFRAEGRSRSAYISPEIERKAQKIKCTHVFVSITEYKCLHAKKFKWNVHRNRTKSRWAWQVTSSNHAFADWGHNYLIVNAIESPSFDVTNGTTRESDPLWSPNLRSSL